MRVWTWNDSSAGKFMRSSPIDTHHDVIGCHQSYDYRTLARLDGFKWSNRQQRARPPCRGDAPRYIHNGGVASSWRCSLNCRHFEACLIDFRTVTANIRRNLANSSPIWCVPFGRNWLCYRRFYRLSSSTLLSFVFCAKLCVLFWFVVGRNEWAASVAAA